MNLEDMKYLKELKRQRELEKKALEALENDREANPFGGVWGEGDSLMYRQKYGEDAYQEAIKTKKLIEAQKRLLKKQEIEDALLEGNIRSDGELANPNSEFSIDVRKAMKEFGLDERQAIAFVRANRNG